MLSCVLRGMEFVLLCVSKMLSPCSWDLARGRTSSEWLLPGLPDTTCPSVLHAAGLCWLPAGCGGSAGLQGLWRGDTLDKPWVPGSQSLGLCVGRRSHSGSHEVKWIVPWAPTVRSPS